MSSNAEQVSQFPSLNAWSKDFMRAAEANPHSRLPRLGALLGRRLGLVLAFAVAIPAGAGIAVATGVTGGGDTVTDPPPFEIVDDGGPPFELPTPGDVLQYVDLKTGDLIRCPDAKPLTLTVAQDGSIAPRPACADGSVPETYVEQQRAWTAFLHSAPPDLAENGPNFQVIAKQGGE